jgi:indole-3-glycerol phosphate synthase
MFQQTHGSKQGMNILDEIVAFKHKEVERCKASLSIHQLELSTYFKRKTISLRNFVLDKNRHGIIAEFKRKSPSKGIINGAAQVGQVARGYFEAGVSGISVLTDEKYFGGSREDLMLAREKVRCPILRKEFIVDEYQIIEAKSIGADAILLIAASLSNQQMKQFCKQAKSLGLDVLLEVHNEEELNQSLDVGADLIGVNNRDLKTFKVSIEISRQLIQKIPKNVPAVSESGIENPATIKELKSIGFSGFLIGQSFMQTSNPGKACLEFINQLKA